VRDYLEAAKANGLSTWHRCRQPFVVRTL